MKKDLLYSPKYLKLLSIMMEKKIIQKEQEQKGIFKKIKRVFK